MPHDQFDRLRAEAPVYWHPEQDDTGFWAITKHADVRTVSHDCATFSSELGGTFIPTRRRGGAARSCASRSSTWTRRKHNRYRKLVSKGFTPRMIRMLVEEIERRAAVVVDNVCEKGEVEFVEEIAAQVPVQMICEMIGLEKELWPRIFELSNQLIGSRDDPDYQELPGGRPMAAAMEVYMLCDAVAADRRANPRDDIMTALVQAEIDGERLDDAELNLFFITLIVAGNETTRNLINHAMLALIDHPDQAQRLRDDPSLWDSAVDEMLRWGSSIHNFRRTATTRHRAARRADQGGRQGRPLLRVGQPRRGGVRRPAHASTSAARRTTTSPSAAAACTTASAPAWPGPRSRPRCASSSSACPTSSWPASPTASTPTSSTASRRCRSASRPTAPLSK